MAGGTAVVGVTILAITTITGPSQVVTVASYGLIDTPEAAAEFSGNDLVFEAVVVGQRPTRLTRATDDRAAATIEYTYTPIDVVVTAVEVGDLRIGDRLVVRVLGGRVGDVEYVFEDTASVEDYAPGTALMLFTEANIDVDGVPAVTPNFVYVIEDGVARSAVHPGQTIEAQAMRQLVESRGP